MTQAYIEGFRKTAEAHGVDPEQLIKTAQMFGLLTGIGRGLGALGKYTMRGASATARGAGRVAGMASQLPSQAARGMRAVGRATGQAAKGLKQDFMSGWHAARPAPAATPEIVIRNPMLDRLVQAARPAPGGWRSAWPGAPANPTRIPDWMQKSMQGLKGVTPPRGGWGSIFNSPQAKANLQRLFRNTAGKAPSATGTRGIPGLIQSNTPSATIGRPVVAGLM